MTNRYLNDFLNDINYPVRVDLARNLQYRRSRYYLRKKVDLKEAIAISKLILEWRFYTGRERVNYLARFWAKNTGFLVSS